MLPLLNGMPLAGCNVSLLFDLPDIAGHITIVRKMVRSLIAEIALSRQDADDVESIVGELATNAVRHACGGGYRVNVEFCDQYATVTVIDQGAGFSLRKIETPGTVRTDELAESTEDASLRFGGYGLPLVRAMSEQVDITANPPPARGMTVRAVKRLHER